jgi:hypothetical protein
MTPERRSRLRSLGGHRSPVEQQAVVRPESSLVVTRVTRVTRHNHRTREKGTSYATGDNRGLQEEASRWADIEERVAMAQHGGGFPERFAIAFARLQLERPPHVAPDTWDTLMDAMGRLLDEARDLATDHSIHIG